MAIFETVLWKEGEERRWKEVLFWLTGWTERLTSFLMSLFTWMRGGRNAPAGRWCLTRSLTGDNKSPSFFKKNPSRARKIVYKYGTAVFFPARGGCYLKTGLSRLVRDLPLRHSGGI